MRGHDGVVQPGDPFRLRHRRWNRGVLERDKMSTKRKAHRKSRSGGPSNGDKGCSSPAKRTWADLMSMTAFMWLRRLQLKLMSVNSGAYGLSEYVDCNFILCIE